MIKENTIFLDGRKIGTYKAVLKAGSGHIDFNGFEPYEVKLNNNQQVVLEWFKNEKKTQPFATVADFFAAYFEGTEEVPLNTMVSFEQLTTVEQYQVLAAFAEWGMKQEEKK